MEKKGAINGYTCDECKQTMYTINKEDGVTPFMIRCRAVNCGIGLAKSHFYIVKPDQRPKWEWYKPMAEELETMEGADREYYKLGAMKLKRIDQEQLERDYGSQFSIRRA